MIKFYPERTIEEQASRLPQAYRNNYKATVLDQVEIDGNVIHGYMEYSFLEEKSYFEQPTRSLNGSIENINTYATFFTPRLIIKYDMMNIEDYRKLMTLLQSKNEFSVTCYDPVLDKRVTHLMYAAPTQMPIIYQQYLMALGIKEFSIELIGTNNGVKTCTVTYDYNLPSGYANKFSQTKATQVFTKNASGIIGETATYVVDDITYSLSSEKTTELLNNRYKLRGWSLDKLGKKFLYLDGNAYFMHNDQTLYAVWEA